MELGCFLMTAWAAAASWVSWVPFGGVSLVPSSASGVAGLHLAQQQPVRAARAEAEARLALLDAPGALERLRAARRLGQAPGAADHIEQSIIDARLRHVEEVARLQALPWQ